eukprot:3555048-Rhodomonas_salina.1
MRLFGRVPELVSLSGAAEMWLGGWNASGKVLCVILHAIERRGAGKQICMVACELFSGSAGGRGGSCIGCSRRHCVGCQCGRDGGKESGTGRSYV